MQFRRLRYYGGRKEGIGVYARAANLMPHQEPITGSSETASGGEAPFPSETPQAEATSEAPVLRSQYQVAGAEISVP